MSQANHTALKATGTNPFDDSGSESGSKNPFGSTSSSTPSSPRGPRKGHARAASSSGVNPFGSVSSLNPFGSANSLNPFGSASSLTKNPFGSDAGSISAADSNHLDQKQRGSVSSSQESLRFRERIASGDSLSSVPLSPLHNGTNLRAHSSLDGSITDSSTAATPRPISPEVELHRNRAGSNMTSILNDPYRRTKGYDNDLFTRSWGSYFVPLTVTPSKHLPPDVPQEKFIPYLQYLKIPYKTARSKEKELASIARARQRSGEHIDIDPVFLDPDFKLSNPQTFEYVLPQSQFEAQGTTNTMGKGKTFVGNAGLPQRSTKLLQEKLSHLLDRVEMKLGEQVNNKSHRFFETIHSQDRLNEDAYHIRSEIRSVREQLSAIDSTVNKNALRILQLHRIRQNSKDFYEKVELMSTVRQAQPTIQLLLSQSDFVGALDLIATTQEVLHDELAGIKSFRHLNVQLCEMERMIYNMIQDDFVKFTLSTLTLAEKTPSEQEDDTDRIICVLFGLLRRRNVNFLQNYKTEANTMTKAKIKQSIAERLSEVHFEGDLKLDDQIRALNPGQAADLVEGVFEGVVALLTKMEHTNKLIKCVVTAAANKTIDEELMTRFSDHARVTLQAQKDPDIPSLLSDADYSKLISESNDVLMTSCELAQSQCIKIITLRQQRSYERMDQNVHFRLSRLVESFAVACERLTGKQSNLLRASMVGQSRELVRQFHSERLTNIRLLLENERWVAADVPADFQRMVAGIVEGAAPRDVTTRPSDARQEPPRSCLLIRGRGYVVTSTLLLVIKILIEYCQCVVDIPVMSKDILTKTVESLKHFNEGTCQLVLMAGAIRNIGLKTITAKHLGIASQSLSVVLELLPWVRGIFATHLPRAQHLLLGQVATLETDIQDHMNQIFSKLITIMGDVYRGQLDSWQPRPPTPSGPITVLTRQTIKLHEALVSVLQPTEIQTVFKGVFCLFRKYFEEQLTKHGLMNCGSNPKRHGIVGAELSHYIDNVSFLEFVGDTDDIFHDIGTR